MKMTLTILITATINDAMLIMAMVKMVMRNIIIDGTDQVVVDNVMPIMMVTGYNNVMMTTL